MALEEAAEAGLELSEEKDKKKEEKMKRIEEAGACCCFLPAKHNERKRCNCVRSHTHSSRVISYAMMSDE